MVSLGVAITLLAAASACGTTPNEGAGDVQNDREKAMSSADEMPAPPGGVPVNQRFSTLDDYLAWLRQTQAPVDGPYYDEIRPGIFSLRTGNLRTVIPEDDRAAEERTFTRAQLLKKFGFRD